MIPNLQQDSIYAAHLRASSSSGGKDWVGSVTARGEIHTYWGKTGQIKQHAIKLGDAHTLNKIITQKMRGKDKYALIDEFTQHQGWQSQRQQKPEPTPPGTQAKPVSALLTVDWVEAPITSIQWDF
jgi:hypothetical protein